MFSTVEIGAGTSLQRKDVCTVEKMNFLLGGHIVKSIQIKRTGIELLGSQMEDTIHWVKERQEKCIRMGPGSSENGRALDHWPGQCVNRSCNSPSLWKVFQFRKM